MQRPAIVRRVLGGLIGARWNRTFLITLLPIFLGLRRVRDVARHPAFVRKIPRVPQITGAAGQKIGIQRYHHIGLIEMVDGVDGLAEGQHRALVRIVAAASFILMPFGARHLF